MKHKKFATQIDEKTLKQLKKFSKETGRSISSVVNEAVEEYLSKSQLRQVFRESMEEVVSDNAELLRRLAK